MPPKQPISDSSDVVLSLFFELEKKINNQERKINRLIEENKREPKKSLAQKKQKIQNLCFVLMPFDLSFDEVYKDIIKRTVEEFSFNCKRADELFGTKTIMSDIWEYIQKADFLIADLTGRNANVFYELGLAHAINKDVILITQRIEDVPFDLKHYRCVTYDNSIKGATKLECGLKGTIADLLKKISDPIQ